MNIAPPSSPPPYAPRTRRAFYARGWFWLLLAAVLLGLAFWLWRSPAAMMANTTPPVAIRAASVRLGNVPLTLHAVGNVVAYESVAVRARLDSQVMSVHFKDGEEVKKGDLLFVLDDNALRARAAELAANIARDKAQLENARRQSGRAAALADKGFATKATQDDLGANVAVAEASLKASQAALESVRVQLGYTRITAPISGRTGTINVTLGNTVKANDPQPLVTINQLKPIRVQVALPQQHFQTLRDAMAKGSVFMAVSKQGNNAAGEVLATGTVEYIDNAVDATTGTFITRAGFANADERLLAGMFVTTTLTLGGDAEAVTVPEVAVQRGQDGDYVFVIMGEKALKRTITVDRLSNGLAAITHGLEVGETVATDGLLGLKDGSVVKVTFEDVASPPAPQSTATPL